MAALRRLYRKASALTKIARPVGKTFQATLKWCEATEAKLKQVRRSLHFSQIKQKERIDFLCLGKNYIQPEVMRKDDRLILYHTWNEEMLRELAAMEIKDQELADASIEIAKFYKEIEDEAPLKME